MTARWLLGLVLLLVLLLSACAQVEVKAPEGPLEFDLAGNLVSSWGGPGEGYDWPSSNHGITVDHKGNVWIGGNGPGDSHILKFTRTGKFIAQYGKPDVRKGPNNPQGQPTYNGGRPSRLNS